MTSNNSDKPLTTGQAAKFCHVTVYTVLNWIKAGKLKAYATPGGQYRVKRDDMHRFMTFYGMPLPAEFEQPRPKKILVVDDETMVVDVMVQILKEYDGSIQVERASDGVEAVLKIGTYQPDLLILDLRMPKMDGCDVCRQVRQNPDTREVKILVVTGYSADLRLAEALQVGANDWLPKPFNHDQFINKISTLLN